MGCNAPLEGHIFSASEGKAEVMEVVTGVGLSEANQGSEDIAPNKAANIMLHAAELFTSAAAGFGIGHRGGRQRRNLGKRVLKLAHGLLALKAGLTAVLLVEVMAELAQRTDALLPVALNLGNATVLPMRSSTSERLRLYSSAGSSEV